jgi:hypothetical protein
MTSQPWDLLVAESLLGRGRVSRCVLFDQRAQPLHAAGAWAAEPPGAAECAAASAILAVPAMASGIGPSSSGSGGGPGVAAVSRRLLEGGFVFFGERYAVVCDEAEIVSAVARGKAAGIVAARLPFGVVVAGFARGESTLEGARAAVVEFVGKLP